MILPVVLLPDTALLVPGVAGRADPLAGLRDAAVLALRDAAEVARRDAAGVALREAAEVARRDAASPDAADVLVIAPGSRDRDLRDPRGSLAAAGVPTALVPEVGPADGPRADVPASVALHLLHAAGVPSAGVRVVETARSRTSTAAPVLDLPALPALIVVVGSPSARDGEDAPLAADPGAPALDEALIAALGTGPAALAAVLDPAPTGVPDPALATVPDPPPATVPDPPPAPVPDPAPAPVPDGPADLAALAVSGAGPWSALTALLARHGLLVDPPGADAAQVLAATLGTALGTHAVARWLLPTPDTAQESR